ncbi:hypothetical protein AAFF_G00227090 [Aldrovandia affinis]|uniref:C2H2-type domain-containing protein n=1 Tax=Aldrovandia affinis TaxID=143900 RepID=A0AAD7X1N9_9TELE|nr:hypothetical protein AAFF_G00227090 [Aldrovandia affinis]
MSRDTSKNLTRPRRPEARAKNGNEGPPRCSWLEDGVTVRRHLKDISGLSGQKPFQCRYCPYSASQKGNLKTHVLCVHRMPFDNSQYPDRRFKRSRMDSDTSEEGNPNVPPAAETAPIQE